MKNYSYTNFEMILEKNNKKLSEEGKTELYKYFTDRESKDLFSYEIELTKKMTSLYNKTSIDNYKKLYGWSPLTDQRIIASYYTGTTEKNILYVKT